MTTIFHAIEFSESAAARRVALIDTLNRVVKAAKKTVLFISAQQAVNAENTGVTRIAPSN